MELTLTLRAAGGERDVVLTAPAGTPLAAVAGALAAAAGVPEATWFDVRGDRVRPDHPVGTAPLLDGAVVGVGVRVPAAPVPGARQLRVVGGPDAGAVLTLGAGDTTIGRGRGVDLRLADPDVSRGHAVLHAGVDGVWVRDAGSTNGTRVTVDADPHDGPTPEVAVGRDPVRLAPGALLRCGGSVLSCTEPTEPPATVRPDGAGGLTLHRPPRLLPRRPATTVTFPDPPPEPTRIRFPWVMVLAPAGLGAVLWAVTGGQRGYLLFALLSPVMYAANAIGDRFAGGRDHRRARARHAEEAADARREAALALGAEVRRRREAWPDPAAVLLTARGPGARLWERRRADPDALVVRIGTADLPAELTVRGPEPPPSHPARRGRWSRREWIRWPRRRPRGSQGGASTAVSAERHPRAPAVPAVVSLRDAGVLGVAGAAAERVALTRWLVGQLAAAHPPRDLRIVLLAGAAGDRTAGEQGRRTEGWRWVRWLPHAAPARGHDVRGALVGLDTSQGAARVAELLAELEARSSATGSASSRDARPSAGPAPGPAYLVVLDGADGLRSRPGVARLLREGPAVGLHAVCLVDDPLALPEECGATVVLRATGGGRARVTVGGDAPHDGVLPDLVSAGWAEQVARALAPVRDDAPEADGGLPVTARLLDLAGAEARDPEALAARWLSRPRSASTVLGAGAEGPVVVDLAADGPHALVAGTTGSGKSELLQTLVAGLALANRPDELVFVLVDYKGGAAFAECARLPHTVGVVTDLDARLTARALESLGAELRRRERALAAVGAPDLEAYQAVRAAVAGTPALPRLVLVVDEFAFLAADLPEFVSGLVDVARRGRSLGVHLVLATQRPSGVVSAEIRANTALRVCLRVTDAAESVDVVDAPAAALLRPETPGRAWVRAASGLVAVQAARVGSRAGPAATPLGVEPAPWTAAGDPRPATRTTAGDGPTDLAVLVDTVRAAAARAAVPPVAPPWLPALPARVVLADLPRAGPDRIPLGLQDRPTEQRRDVFALDLAAGRHLMLVGGPGSGRTTVLRTLAGALAGAADRGVHLYVLDGGGGLASLEELAFCGTVVPTVDLRRGARLVDRLLAEVSRRREVLAGAGCASLSEQRAGAAPGEALPWIVVLLDSYEAFLEAYGEDDGGRVVDDLERLLREGPAAGLRVVLTGGRRLAMARVASLVGDRLVLRQADPDDYATAGVAPRAAPRDPPPGRALVAGIAPTEVQLALLDRDAAGAAQVAALRRIAATPTAAPNRARDADLIAVRPLPERVRLADVVPSVPPTRRGALVVTWGLGGDAAEPVGTDLAAEGPGFLVAGPPGSGRTTALRTAFASLTAAGVAVALVCPARSPLEQLAGTADVAGPFGPGDDDALGAVLADRRERALTVLVDEAELFTDTPVDAVLARVLSTAEPAWALVAAGTTDDLAATYRGFTMPLRRGRLGLLLGRLRPSDGELLGVRVPPVRATPAGAGLLAVRGRVTPVQIAFPESRLSASAGGGGRLPCLSEPLDASMVTPGAPVD